MNKALSQQISTNQEPAFRLHIHCSSATGVVRSCLYHCRYVCKSSGKLFMRESNIFSIFHSTFVHSQSILVRHCGFFASKFKRSYIPIFLRATFKSLRKYEVMIVSTFFNGAFCSTAWRERHVWIFIANAMIFYLIKLETIVQFADSKPIRIIHAHVFSKFHRSIHDFELM